MISSFYDSKVAITELRENLQKTAVQLNAPLIPAVPQFDNNIFEDPSIIGGPATRADGTGKPGYTGNIDKNAS